MEELEQKQHRLISLLEDMESVLVAYSGGADSAFLAWQAYQVLGNRSLAVIADSPSLPRSHFRDALVFAEQSGFSVRAVRTDEMEREAYAVNDSMRCFHCKDELFRVLSEEGQKLGIPTIIYGLNADDTRDYRPGQKAAGLHGVRAPLAEAGLTKEEVRELARRNQLSIWDKPAAACLASRVEYGRRVTPEALHMIEIAEEGLLELGFRQFRVRHHGVVARVEISEAELPKALTVENFHRISAVVKKAGFKFAAVDCDGYRSGSMNDLLPAEVLFSSRAAL
jgi:pyridinium-3,5-biscarboxylic acid mononucleotide sulfurtransferase